MITIRPKTIAVLLSEETTISISRHKSQSYDTGKFDSYVMDSNISLTGGALSTDTECD